VLSKGVDTAQHELITVRCRLRHPRHTGHAACATDVLDDDLLTQDFGKASAENSRQGIGGAACRERHHHGDRPGRPVLRRCRMSERNECSDGYGGPNAEMMRRVGNAFVNRHRSPPSGDPSLISSNTAQSYASRRSMGTLMLCVAIGSYPLIWMLSR